jgi:hypothetical protein
VLIDILAVQFGAQNGDELAGFPWLAIRKESEDHCFQETSEP